MAFHIFKNVSLSNLLLTDTQDTLQDKFKHIETSKNWHDAQMHCRTHYVDLAAITDDNENAFLAQVLSSQSLNDAWIGLYKVPWLWSDNTSVSWSSVKWASGQPDNVNGNDCARADTEGLTAADTCSTTQPFYCRENRKIQRVRFTVKSDGHLDESTVMEAIEKKVTRFYMYFNITNMLLQFNMQNSDFRQY